MEPAVQIRHLTSLAEYEHCEELQKTVWGFGDTDVVPSRLMIIAHLRGGLALGAFASEAMVGFLFAFGSVWQGEFSQHSHMLGVLPDFRDRGVGRSLKLAQYEDALRRGIPMVTWTFDPLETRNAFLNLNRLGAVSCTYHVNLYGERTSSALHSALGTDRFLARWAIGSPRAEAAIAGRSGCGGGWEEIPCALGWSGRERFLPGPADFSLAAPRVKVEVPGEIHPLRALDPAAAIQWREATRAVFARYFSRGYWIKSLLRPEAAASVPGYSARRTFYLLEPHEG